MCECSTFWLIKLTLDLVSVADFFSTDITKQVLNVNGHHRFSSLVRVIGKNSPLRSSAMKGGSTYQVWSHSDKHRRSFIELCSSDVITAKRPACLMYYVRTRYARAYIF